MELVFSLLNKDWFFEISILYTGQRLSIPTVYAQIKNISENEVTTMQDLTESTRELSVVRRRFETGWVRAVTGMGVLGMLCGLFLILASLLVRDPELLGYVLANKFVAKIVSRTPFGLVALLLTLPYMYVLALYLGMHGYWELMNEYGANNADLISFVLLTIGLTGLTCAAIALFVSGLVKVIRGRHK